MNTTALCKKCGAEHLISQYAGSKYYVCDSVKRVILLAPEDEQTVKPKQPKQPNEAK